jgi:hypothetical protein
LLFNTMSCLVIGWRGRKKRRQGPFCCEAPSLCTLPPHPTTTSTTTTTTTTISISFLPYVEIACVIANRLGVQLAQLEVAKRQSVKTEDYDRAKVLKEEINSLRSQITQTLNDVDQALGAEIGGYQGGRPVGGGGSMMGYRGSSDSGGGYRNDMGGNVDGASVGFGSEPGLLGPAVSRGGAHQPQSSYGDGGGVEVGLMNKLSSGGREGTVRHPQQFDPDAPVPAMRSNYSGEGGLGIYDDSPYGGDSGPGEEYLDGGEPHQGGAAPLRSQPGGLRHSNDPGGMVGIVQQGIGLPGADDEYADGASGAATGVEELDPTQPHPLEGVEGFADLAAPESLSMHAGTGEANETGELVRVLGEYVVRCLYSEKWELRQAALVKTRLQLPGLCSAPGISECTQPLCRVLHKGLEAEKNAQVILRTMELAEACCEQFPNSSIPPRELQHKLDGVVSTMVSPEFIDVGRQSLRGWDDA